MLEKALLVEDDVKRVTGRLVTGRVPDENGSLLGGSSALSLCGASTIPPPFSGGGAVAFMSTVRDAATRCGLPPTDSTLGDESIHVARAGSNANIDVVFLRHDGVVIEVAMNINDPCQASWTDQLARASAQRLDKAQL